MGNKKTAPGPSDYFQQVRGGWFSLLFGGFEHRSRVRPPPASESANFGPICIFITLFQNNASNNFKYQLFRHLFGFSCAKNEKHRLFMRCFSPASFLATQVGTAEGIRPPDLLVRSQSLYPTELQPHTAKGIALNSLISIAQFISKCKRYFYIFSIFFDALPSPILRNPGASKRCARAHKALN